MISFGKKLRECREAQKFSQSKLAKEVGLHHSIIGRYERDEAKPTIDVVKRLATTLKTTVGYLLGETEDTSIFKDPSMLQRLKELSKLSDHDKERILYTLDGLLQNVKAKQAYTS
ncbi:MAG: helix-turn-helix transcriptional regulator [Crocinitomicaceae bacterium]|nr:helix-turn-helix transcriptional regulator [Crocinitomicaceae bacterium]MBL4861679.1 helix-turn-helix transcriptional regulator [Crocinitomicaceae bacterium]